MNLISIREILEFPDKIPNTWLYLPPDCVKWTLDTMGVFSLDSIDYPNDSDDYIPIQAKEGDWISIFDYATIQDIIDNACEQLGNTQDINQLFEAFIYYYQNDAFIEF